MRIAQIATLDSPVRSEGSSSVEGLVWALTRGLVERGHAVTVFASAGSTPHGELVATLPGPYAAAGSFEDWQLCELVTIAQALEQSSRFDVVHSHNYLRAMPLEPLSAAQMVHTLHVLPCTDEAGLVQMYPNACVSAISAYQWSEFPAVRPAAVIHHGVDPGAFTFRPDPDDYLCYLGRFLPTKGVIAAITLARQVGVPLRLAGPRDDFFREAVEDLCDGASVTYVGEVSGEGRNRLLGGARALLYPIEDPEPFGLVMPEAMMCGTPVVATPVGAVPEIVDDGVTGCYPAPGEPMADVVDRAMKLDRHAVRAAAMARFHVDRMVAGYERLYETVT